MFPGREKLPIPQSCVCSSGSSHSPLHILSLSSPKEDTVSHKIIISPAQSAMQRGSYAPPPAHSPPLHHPVPQHVSTVPMMRSPPPPQSQNGNYGSPYSSQQITQTQAAPASQFAPAFGGFVNDHTAQMGFQVGKSAVMAGQEYVEQNVCGFQICYSLLSH